MEEAIAITTTDSDIRVEKPENEWEIYDSKFPTWATRYTCFKAYICVMNYQSTLTLCQRLGKYGMTIIVPYLIFNIFIGVPAVLVEVMIGRFIKANVAEAWNMCPIARGVFACLLFVAVSCITSNYIFGLYLLKYFFAALQGYLVWESCNESFAKKYCYETGKKSEAIKECIKTASEDYCQKLHWESSAVQYWKSISGKTNAEGIFIAFAIIAAMIVFVSFFIYKGIHSLEKMLGIFVYPSIVFWVLMVVGTFSSNSILEGFEWLFGFKWSHFLGIQTIIRPEIKRIKTLIAAIVRRFDCCRQLCSGKAQRKKFSIWVDAFEDCFLLLGLCKIAFSFVSSHGKFTDNILYDVLLVIFCTLFCCLLASLPTLSTIVIIKKKDGHNMSQPLFKDVTDVFVSMSEALTTYPYPKTMWCVIQYLDCFLISISSQAILVLAVCEALHGVFKRREKYYFYIVVAISLLSYILAGGFMFYKDVIELTHATSAITVVIISTITWQLFYGIRKFNLDYFYMMGRPLPLFLKFTWITLLVLPIAGLILKMSINPPLKVYVHFGCIVSIFTLSAGIIILRSHQQNIPIAKVFQPNPDWGPDNPLLKKSRMVFDKSTVTREFMYRQELYKKPMKKPPDFKMQSIVQQM